MPKDVEVEVRPMGFAARDRFDESDATVGGQPLPMRSKIVAVLVANAKRQLPFKCYLTSSWGGGWLVAEEKGWSFHPQATKEDS